MTIHEFVAKMADLVQYRLGDSYYVSPTTVTKNNGLILHGLVLQKKGMNISPTIYMEQLYAAYEDGMPLYDIVNNIFHLCMENEKVPFNVSNFTDFESIRKKIIFQLVNTEKNAALLKEIPSKRFLDFSIIFRVLFESNSKGTASAIITNNHLDIWKTDTDEIYHTAMTNTPVLQKAVIRSIDDILADHIDKNMIGVIPMYVLTNEQNLNGCGCILYPHILEYFGERIGYNFFILPSSTHEVILVPEIVNDSFSLIQIVREINRTIVSQEEFLSNHVYYFSRKSKQITIIL